MASKAMDLYKQYKEKPFDQGQYVYLRERLTNTMIAANEYKFAKDLLTETIDSFAKEDRFCPTTVMKLGDVHFKHGNLSDAIKVFEELRLRCDGLDRLPVLEKLCQAYEKSGRKKEAEQIQAEATKKR